MSDVRTAGADAPAPQAGAAERRRTCRSCGAPLAGTFLDLGVMPPANAYTACLEEARAQPRYPLRARVCGGCLLVQLDCDVAPRLIFGDYAYFSSYSESWLAHARAFCAEAIERFGLGPESLVVELASNDGYLLRNMVAAGVPCLGIEPSHTVAAAAEAAGVPTEVAFFGTHLAGRLAADGRRADLVVANNVLAHVPDLNDFVAGIAAVLKPDGVLSAEFPHLQRLIEGAEFDTIYHEHYSYFSLLSVERCFERHGLQVYDVAELPTHGGSLRIFAAPRTSGRAPTAGLAAVRAGERAAGLDRPGTYDQLAPRAERCRAAFRGFLAEAGARGARIVGYGAAAKGVTFLNYCGVGPAEIAFVVDRNPHKQGRVLPGSRIPVGGPADLDAARPDYVLILPWNLRQEIAAQLAHVREWGGRLVTALPELRID